MSEEEEAQDEEDKEEGDEGITMPGEETNKPGEEAERDDNVFDGDKDVDPDTIRGSDGSEADESESVRSNGDKDK